jgi:hypothetical protein
VRLISGSKKIEEYTKMNGPLLYSISGSETSVVGYSGNDSYIIIPSYHDSLPVTEIEDMAFNRNGDNLELVTVRFEEPSYVWRIGAYAFHKCVNLTITLPESITNIEYGAFMGVGGIMYEGQGIYFKGEPTAGTGEIGSVQGYYPYAHAAIWEDALIDGEYRGLPMSQISSEMLDTMISPRVSTGPSFQTPLRGHYYTTESTFLFNQKTIKSYISTPKVARNWTQGEYPPVGTPLKDTGRRVFAFGRNKLKTYEFREVQRTDTLESGYLCVWASSGVYPSGL